MSASEVRYASGEVPEVGDTVRCVSEGLYLKPGDARVVHSLREVLNIYFAEWPGLWYSPKDFELVFRRTDPATIDGSGVFHPAPVSDVPKEEAPDWQPFDGEFKAGVEYRSRDGNVWRYSCDDGTARMSVRLITDNQNIKSGWFNKDGSSAPPDWDITHQRLRPAETGDQQAKPGIIETVRAYIANEEPTPQPASVPKWCKDAGGKLRLAIHGNVAAAACRCEPTKDWAFVEGNSDEELGAIIARFAPADYDALQERCDALTRRCADFIDDGARQLRESERLEAEVAALRTQLATANRKAATSLANNLCPDHRDKQAGKPCLACEIETLTRKLATATERTAELDWYITAVRDFNDRLRALGHEPGGFVIDSIWVCDELRRLRSQMDGMAVALNGDLSLKTAMANEIEELRKLTTGRDSANYGAGMLELQRNNTQLREQLVRVEREVQKLNAEIGNGGSPPPYPTWRQQVATLTAERDRIAGELEAVKVVVNSSRSTLDNIARNYDCDSDAHKYDTPCRKCDAESEVRIIDNAIAALAPAAGVRG